MPVDLLKLPFQIQLALASGYAAYLISYVGIREHHTAVDVTFKSLVFSLIATGTFYIVNLWSGWIMAAEMAAFIACCTSGVIWRRYLTVPFRRALRVSDVSWSDDDPSAWASILANSKHRMSQLSILMDDGTWLICDNVGSFENSPFGPCKLGASGDIALYVTSIKAKSGGLWTKETSRRQLHVKDASYGDNITYVPASKIRYVKLRYK